MLSQHPAWQDVIAYDAFGECVVKTLPPPVREQDGEGSLGEWTDADTVRTVAWIATTVGFEPSTQAVNDAVAAVAERRVFHPVRDFLSGLRWDGKPRLNRLLATHFGVEDTPYTHAVGAKWMLSAVARAMRPGCQADSMLVLESPAQGLGKSTALRILAGDQWFADTGIEVGNKDSYQALRRKWIYEFAELSSIRGKEVERVKNFVSSRSDNYRPSYGRRNRDFPRQVVFAGSTNEQHYLTDPTGARRFWPVRCTRIDLDALARDREQLWAEARVRYEQHEAHHLETTDLRDAAAAIQEERMERDDWIDQVSRWLMAPSIPSGERAREPLDPSEGYTTLDVLLGALSFTPDRITSASTKRVGHVLRALGFEPRRLRENNARVRRYFPSQVSQVDENEPGTPNEHDSGCGPGVPCVPCDTRAHKKGDTWRGVLGGNSDPVGPLGPPGTRDGSDEERDAIETEDEGEL